MSRLDPFTTLEPSFARARDLGFLGPGPVASHIEHALGFVEVIEARFDPPNTVIDLGSGAGVPGLVLAACWPAAHLVFIESMNRRVVFLVDAVARLGWESRISVVHERAEAAARKPELREAADVVTARSFAEPAATAEIGSAFVRLGGILVVSEPPADDPARWPQESLRSLSLGPASLVAAKQAHFSVFSKDAASPAEVPRATGRPTKRPLW
ncbi:MAG TPA: RsmG family class I SAM-dependent methyltransferase [Acidimicrobiia bacterium]|nr:RsmG family class I SAM-dependent methyltransferase [Acidimicrobiia bacterium]